MTKKQKNIQLPAETVSNYHYPRVQTRSDKPDTIWLAGDLLQFHADTKRHHESGWWCWFVNTDASEQGFYVSDGCFMHILEDVKWRGAPELCHSNVVAVVVEGRLAYTAGDTEWWACDFELIVQPDPE